MEVRFAGEEKKMDATEHATEEAALENIIAGCIRGATPPPTTYIVKGWEVVPRTWMPDENRATFRNDHVAVPVTIRWSVNKVKAEITTDYRRAVSLRG